MKQLDRRGVLSVLLGCACGSAITFSSLGASAMPVPPPASPAAPVMVPKASPAVPFTMPATVIGAACVAGCGVGTGGITTDRCDACAVARLAVATLAC